MDVSSAVWTGLPEAGPLVVGCGWGVGTNSPGPASGAAVGADSAREFHAPGRTFRAPDAAGQPENVAAKLPVPEWALFPKEGRNL